jgi:hypothetical protein
MRELRRSDREAHGARGRAARFLQQPPCERRPPASHLRAHDCLNRVGDEVAGLEAVGHAVWGFGMGDVAFMSGFWRFLAGFG